MKATTISQSKRRITIIKGQMDGLLRMIEEDKYCVDVLNQSLAIQNSLKSLDAVILEGHLETHVTHQFKENDPRAVSELLTLYTRMKK